MSPESIGAPASDPTASDAASAEAAALLDALRSVLRELRLVERRGNARAGLHPAQLHALRELAARPTTSLAELAERTHTDPSSASVVVQRLVERGLLERTEAEADRRRTELRITAAGRAALAEAPAGAAAHLAEAMAPLGEWQAAALARGLRTLAHGLRQTQGEGETA